VIKENREGIICLKNLRTDIFVSGSSHPENKILIFKLNLEKDKVNIQKINTLNGHEDSIRNILILNHS